VALICELDEQWSFVGSKARQHWLWYAYNTKTGGVLAYTFGPRTDKTCRELLALLTPFNIGMITCDDWGSYGREVPPLFHTMIIKNINSFNSGCRAGTRHIGSVSPSGVRAVSRCCRQRARVRQPAPTFQPPSGGRLPTGSRYGSG